MEKIEQYIKNTPLNGKIQKKFLKKLKIINLSFGEYLHYSGKDFKSIFFILDGLVQLKQSTQEGIDINYGFLEEFNFIGEKKILFNSDDAIDFYILRDNTKILEIPLEVAEELIKNDKFRIYLLELHSDKLHKLASSISILHFLGVSKFLAYNILKYSINDTFIFKNISFLSSVLGMDRKSVYNSIKYLEKNNLIERNSNLIKIKNKKKLEEYVNF